MRPLAAAVAAAALLTLGIARASAQSMPMHTPTPAPYTSTVGAHARYSKARINLLEPNLDLAAAVYAAGGGPTAFDAATFVQGLTGSAVAAQSERASLVKRFGADKVTVFERALDFAMKDGLAQMAAFGMAVPPPGASAATGPALAVALSAAGTSPRGAFDVEYLLDALFSHVVHVAVMNDIDAHRELGPSADETYHTILRALITDVAPNSRTASAAENPVDRAKRRA